LTPSCCNSGEVTQRLGSITKRGSKLVRYLLNQAVVRLLLADGSTRTWLKRIKQRRSAKIARVEVTQRLPTILLRMFKKKWKYLFDLPFKKRQEFKAYEGSAA